MNLVRCIRAGDKDMRQGFAFSFFYDPDTVEELKRAIPHTEREWREESKTWWVSAEYESSLKRLFGNFEALVYLQGELL